VDLGVAGTGAALLLIGVAASIFESIFDLGVGSLLTGYQSASGSHLLLVAQYLPLILFLLGVVVFVIGAALDSEPESENSEERSA